MEGEELSEDIRQPNQPNEVTQVRCFSPAPASDGGGGVECTSPASPDQSNPLSEQAVGSALSSMAPSMTTDGGGLSSSLYAEVWQYVGDAWKEVYHFNNGLEFDCLSARPEASQWSRLHLPSTSLKALQRLRAALQTPKAIQLDICPGTSRGLVFTALYEQAAGVLDAMGDKEISRTEIQRILEERGAALAETRPVTRDDENMSVNSEALVEPREETEAVDISICPLPMSKEMPPIVAFARLSDPMSRHPGSDQSASPQVRFAALVLCSARGKVCSAQLGREIGRALAISCMDEEFARVACTCENPQEMLDYLDSYLSTLTLVPTVYMMAASPSRTPTEEMVAKISMRGRLELGYMLTDSMVDGIERRIRKRRRLPSSTQEGKLHYCRHDREKHPWSKRRRYFIEVHERSQATQHWCVTQRLWQGLGVHIDANTGAETSPQLPNVSEPALDALKNIFRPESIGLDVASETVPKMIENVVHQLACAGLTKANGADDVAAALRQWFEVKHNQSDASLEFMAQDSEGDDKFQADPVSPKLAAGSKQVPPQAGDEACHIIVIASSAVPQKQGLLGTCVRFASPLTTGFTPTGSHAGSLARFLMVVVGPENACGELSSLTEALGALTVDEDLMGDLTLAESGPIFCDAIDLWLADLTVVSRSQVKRNKGTISRFSGRFQKHLMTPTNTEPPEKAQAVTPIDTVHTDTSEDQEVELLKKRQKKPSMTCRKRTKWFVGKLQKYSIPLCTGVTLAMVWENVHADSYHDFTHTPFWKDASLFGHDLNLHFIVNDIFMCFFFGLAMKEVAEALLPGGSLNPLSRAINPLFATAGGIVVPIAVYCVCIVILDASGSFDETMCEVTKSDRRLGGGGGSSGTGVMELCPMSSIMKGWGVPTATDISLAWMFALLVFGAGHPCINFLLLLAIVDDAIGMIIIAVFYPNPEKPVDPLWLLLVLASVIVACGMRYLHLHHWQVYIFIAGPLSWLGLIKAHVHPALALVSVVPCMPAKAARQKKSPLERHMTFRWSRVDLSKTFNRLPSIRSPSSGGSSAADSTAAAIAAAYGDISEEQRAKAVRRASDLMRSAHHAPLHAFEEALKLPVDLGMFFFGVANAGVQMGAVGGITIAVVAALFAGKTFGIAGFGLLASCLGFPLPQGIGVADLFAASALGGIGLTVALFVANQAFVDVGLQGQAKMGAVISILCALLAWMIKRFCGSNEDDEVDDVIECDPAAYADVETTTVHAEDGDGEFLKGTTVPKEEGEDDDFIVDSLIDDILQTYWIKHEYERHGTEMPIEPRRRSISKDRSSRSSMGSMGSIRPMRGSLRLSSKELDRGSVNGRGSSRCYSRESTSILDQPWAWRSSSRSNIEPATRPTNGVPAQAWGPRSDAPKATAPSGLATNGEAQGPGCGRESPTLLTLSEVGQSSTPPPPEPENKTKNSPRMLV